MTLQERYDAKKADADALGQQYQQAQQQLGQMQQQMIRLDAELALLEELLKPVEKKRK